MLELICRRNQLIFRNRMPFSSGVIQLYRRCLGNIKLQHLTNIHCRDIYSAQGRNAINWLKNKDGELLYQLYQRVLISMRIQEKQKFYGLVFIRLRNSTNCTNQRQPKTEQMLQLSSGVCHHRKQSREKSLCGGDCHDL